MARADRGLPRSPARHPRDAERHVVRRRHPAHPGTGPVRAHRLRGVSEGRRRQPDRVVQGPRHDDGDLQGRRGGRAGRHLRVDREHLGERGCLRGARGHDLCRARPAGQDRAREDGTGTRARREAVAGRRQLRRLPRARPQARRRLPGRAGELGEPVPHRGAEDRGVRDLRRARSRTRRALHPGRQRRKHHRVLEGLSGVLHGRSSSRRRRACSASRPPARRR